MVFSVTAYGQFFEEEQQQGQDEPFSDNSGYFDGSGPNYNQPEYGADGETENGTDGGPGNPGHGVPIDDWLFLLPLAGAAVGAYFLRRRRQKVY